jgi:nucleoside-diphosphate-sugar epimerase
MGVLVTGGNGLVGTALLLRLSLDSVPCVAVVRRKGEVRPGCVSECEIGDIGPDTIWDGALEGINAVVHLAARVHVMQDAAADPLEEFRRTNVHASLNLARQAAAAGIRRFIFVSSVKVNGEYTRTGQSFGPDDLPRPVDAYGISKMEAESGLRAIARESGIELVIIRPPLVYGPGVKANFAAMMRWLHRGIPLPLGSVHNRRSLVALDNLVDLITVCLHHPGAANQTFMAGDGEDLSTTELLRCLGDALGRPARLLPLPSVLLTAGAALLGRKDIARRLCDSLQVDIGKTRTLLMWRPPVSVAAALKSTAHAFLQNGSL